MNYEITEFLHGLIPTQNKLPCKLYRFPEERFNEIRPETAVVFTMTSNNEVRFVLEDEIATLSFEFESDETKIEFFCGDFLQKIEVFPKGIHEINCKYPPFITKLLDKNEGFSNFSPKVIRLVIRSKEATLLNLPDGIRPATKEELPKKNYLAYGTSITQGGSASTPHMTYPSLVARKLNTDVINLGAQGNAFCEEAIAHFMADNLEWDFCSCCVSVNMLNQGVPLDDFRDKVEKFLTILVDKHPEKPIFCISIFPYFVDFDLPHDKNLKSTPEEYRNALQSVVEKLSSKGNIHIVNGKDLLLNRENLTADLLHPSDFGYMQIAENLTKKILEVIKI